MKKLLTIIALLFTIGAKAQLDSISWSINGNGVDTLFYQLIPHNAYSYPHCAYQMSQYWATTLVAPAITKAWISADTAAILDTLYYNAYNVGWSNTGIGLYPLQHSRGGNIYTFKCYLY